MLKKTLQCLEGIHLSQSGSLLMLYVDKLLNTPFRVLARMVDTLACRRVEMLLAETLQVCFLGNTSQQWVKNIQMKCSVKLGKTLSHSEKMLTCFIFVFFVIIIFIFPPSEQYSSAACGGTGKDPRVPPDQWLGSKVPSFQSLFVLFYFI